MPWTNRSYGHISIASDDHKCSHAESCQMNQRKLFFITTTTHETHKHHRSSFHTTRNPWHTRKKKRGGWAATCVIRPVEYTRPTNTRLGPIPQRCPTSAHGAAQAGKEWQYRGSLVTVPLLPDLPHASYSSKVPQKKQSLFRGCSIFAMEENGLVRRVITKKQQIEEAKRSKQLTR